MVDTSTGKDERRILIVDDSLMSLKLLTHMITLQGYGAESVTTGREAIASAQTSPPDLILLDIMMPEMDGFEVARELQADPRTQDVPIIFISALSDEKSKVKAFTAGGVDYVSKPLHVNEVIARVGTHLRLRDATHRLQVQLDEREELITELDAVNEQLTEEIVEREAAQAQLQQVLAKTEALYRISRTLITSSDILDMLQTATDSVAQALPADRVLTVTLDTEARKVTFYAEAGSASEMLAPPDYDELMDGLTGWVVKRVQPVISPSGQPDPRESVAARQRRKESGIGAMIVVPFYYQGVILGTIAAMNREGQPDFNGQHLAQLSAIAGQVSVALANARLSAETAYLKEFNEGIVQGVAEAILLTDDAQRVTFANRAAVTMLGYSAQELVGKPCAVLFAADQGDMAADRLRACQSGTASRFETVLERRDGTRVPVLASIRPLYQEGKPTGSLAALTDITEIKQAEEQLRQYAADLKARNSELDAFAHTVAHDLRSPLTGLIGFIDLLEMAAREHEIPEFVEYAHYLNRNSIKMNNIIDELLLLASVREVDDVDIELVDMGRIVHEARARLDYLIDEYHAVVTAPETWPPVPGYAPWIEEVWVNYLSNAVKYGGKPDRNVPPRIELGYDLVEIALEGVDTDGEDGAVPAVRFWVRDNGAGLTAEQQSQLFTPFERLHNVRAEGHGLGLSIVRRILEKLGGSVGVESKKGKGSTFYFVLPVT
ncbi:MAG: response regulator [Anaerolineae bacterium]|nr:response regulator [Anaerolineae bacterium]